MKIRIMCLSLFVASAVQVYGQGESVKGLRISEFYVQGGGGAEGLPYSDIRDFQRLAPNSQILSQDYMQNGLGWGANRSRNFNFSAGIAISGKSDPGQPTRPWQIRAGLQYGGGTLMVGHNFVDTRKHFDTIYDSNGVPVFLRDSVFNGWMTAMQRGRELRIDLSILFRTNSAKRWSFFAGAGITAGYSLLAFTQIRSSGNYQIVLRRIGTNPGSSSMFWAYQPGSTEYYRNKPYVVGSVYVPMGLNFRMGKKSELLKNTHLYYELRPSLNFRHFKEIGSRNYPSLFNALGFRYNW